MDDLPPDNMVPFLLLAGFRGLVDELHGRLLERGFGEVRAIHGLALQAIGGGCTAVELARRLGVSKQAATKTVQALEALGFVTRQVNPRDRRERRVIASAEGKRMLVESGIILTEVIASWRSANGDRDIDTTIRTLAAIDHGRRSLTDVSDWF